MSLVAGILVALSLAQPAAPPAEQAPIKASVTAVRAAFSEGNEFSIDDEISSLKTVFSSMDQYNKFTLVSRSEEELVAAQEIPIKLNELYTLYVTEGEVTPPSAANAPARVTFDARVGLQQGGKELDALSGRGEAPIGQPLLFQDLPMGDDKLIVLLRFTQDDEGDEGSDENEQDEQQQQQDQQPSEGDENQEQQQQSDQQSEQQQDPQQQEEDSQQDEQEQTPEAEQEQEGEQQDQQMAQESEQPPKEQGEKEAKHGEDSNIEALLESLEEVDRREQELERQSNVPSRIKGDWW